MADGERLSFALLRSSSQGLSLLDSELSGPRVTFPPTTYNKKTPPKGRFFIMADGERFELSVSFETYTHFPGVRLKPLGHPSTENERR